MTVTLTTSVRNWGVVVQLIPSRPEYFSAEKKNFIELTQCLSSAFNIQSEKSIVVPASEIFLGYLVDF